MGITKEAPDEGKVIEISEKTLHSERAPGVLAHEIYHALRSPRRADPELFRQLGIQSLEGLREELEAAFFAAAKTGQPPSVGHLRWVWMYAWDSSLTKDDFYDEMREAAERVGYEGPLPQAAKFKDHPIPGRAPIDDSW